MNEAPQTPLAEEQATPSQEQATPSQGQPAPSNKQKDKPKLHERIGEKLASMPEQIDTAIEDGKGNEVIASVQEVVSIAITSIFSSCRIIALQLYMLSEKQRADLSKACYILGAICTAGTLVSLLLSFSWNNLLYSTLFIISAFLADVVIQRTKLEKRKQQKISKPKPKSKPVKPKSEPSDDDYI